MSKVKQLQGLLLSWKTIAASSFLVLLALVLLWISSAFGESSPIIFGAVLPAFASVIATSGVFAIFYEVFVRRQQTEFVLESIELKESLIAAGLDNISVNYLDFDYANKIIEARDITIFALYAHTWFNRYIVEINEHLKSPNSHLKVVLPSLDNRFLRPLYEHFNYSEEAMKGKIAETISTCLSSFFKSEIAEGSSIKIYMHKDRPCYSMYKFDSQLLVGTYYASRARRRSPMFLFTDKPGGMFSEFNDDLETVINDNSELIFCSSGGVNRVSEFLGDYLPQELR